MKTKIYLDTSVPSAYFDTSKPIRQLITQKWFENDSAEYELLTSIVMITEINQITNEEKRNNIKSIILNHKVKILQLTDQALRLAEEYIQKGAIPASEKEDAWHIAVATVNRIESLVSWNFKHIVSINPIRKIHYKSVGTQVWGQVFYYKVFVEVSLLSRSGPFDRKQTYLTMPIHRSGKNPSLADWRGFAGDRQAIW